MTKQKTREQFDEELFNEQLLKEVLGEGRAYVSKHAKALDIPITAVQHEIATSTCKEKSDLLRRTHGDYWTPDRIVKALYFAFANRLKREVYGFVVPELGKRLDADVVHGVIAAKNNRSPSYDAVYMGLNGQGPFGHYIPNEMARGTCTPFPTAGEMDQISRIYIHNMPSLSGRPVDISIGGKGERWHKVSLHLPYEAIAAILTREYDRDKIRMVNLFPK